MARTVDLQLKKLNEAIKKAKLNLKNAELKLKQYKSKKNVEPKKSAKPKVKKVKIAK